MVSVVGSGVNVPDVPSHWKQIVVGQVLVLEELLDGHDTTVFQVVIDVHPAASVILIFQDTVPV